MKAANIAFTWDFQSAKLLDFDAAMQLLRIARVFFLFALKFPCKMTNTC